MLSYSQRDPRWSEVEIPGSTLKIGRFGCLITVVADMANFFGQELTPLDVARICKFTSTGLLYWSSCVFTAFRWERREYGRNDEKILEAISDPDRAVVLEVADRSHWVLPLVHFGAASSIIFADPWLGDFAMMERYRNSITGASYFRKK